MTSTNIVIFLRSKDSKLDGGNGKSSFEREGNTEAFTKVFHAEYSRLRHLYGFDNVLTTSLYASQGQDILVCVINPLQDIHFLLNEVKSHGLGDSIQCRVYQQLNVPVEANKTPSRSTHILVCNAMTPTSESEEDYNKWYDEEHVLLLSCVPSWIYSARYRLVDSTDDAPRYLAIHTWEDASAFQSPEYAYAVDTPWKWRVVNSVLRRERGVYDYCSEFDVLESTC